MEAYVSWNGGVCRVIDRQTQKLIVYSIHFRRAARRAQNLGYDVMVFKGENVQASRGAVKIALFSYTLPRKKI